MSATRSIAKNTLLLTVGLMTGRILALLLQRKMTPILGPDGYGILTAAIGLTAILQVVTNFGLGTLLTREITKARVMTLPLFWAALRIRWLLGGVCYLFLLGFVSVAGYEAAARTATLVMALAIFIEATSMACDAVLQAHDKVQIQTLGQVISACVFFGLGWIWLEQGHGLMGVVWANVISRVVRLGIMAPLMFLLTGPWNWRDPEGRPAPSMRWLMRLGVPLFLSTTFGIVYNQIDAVMLKSMVGNASSGIYGLGHRALDAMIILPGLFGTALFPAMARYGQQTSEDAVRLGERSLRFLLAGIFPLTLLVTFLAGPLIGLLDPAAKFADSVLVFQIVIWALPFQAASTIFNRLLITAEQERKFITIGLVPMVVNIVLNIILIPRYDYFGASAATIVSYLISFLMHVHFLRESHFLPVLRRAVLGTAVATTAAWLTTVLIVRAVWQGWSISWWALPLDLGWGPVLVTIGITTGLYGLFLAALRIIELDDLRLLGQLVGRDSPQNKSH